MKVVDLEKIVLLQGNNFWRPDMRRIKRFLRRLAWVIIGLVTIWALVDPTGFTRTLDYHLKTRADLIIASAILFLLARWVWRELKKIFK